MFSRPPTYLRRGGFTLIELLVVIAIVGILAAILFPAFTAMQNSAKKTQALNDCKNLLTACFNYRTEYGKLPLTPGQEAGGLPPYNSDTVYGDPGDKAMYPGYLLIDTLRAISTGVNNDKGNKNNVLNPSQTVYFTAPFVKLAKEPRSGILKMPYQEKPDYTLQPGAFVDPWGSEYLVWLDSNKDYDLMTGTRWFYPKTPDEDVRKGQVQVGSMGADGDFGKDGKIAGSDDVIVIQ